MDKFDTGLIERISNILSSCCSHHTFGSIFAACGFDAETYSLGLSKPNRIERVLQHEQQKSGTYKVVLRFIKECLSISRFANSTEEFERYRTQLNDVLKVVGLEYGTDCRFREIGPGIYTDGLFVCDDNTKAIDSDVVGRIWGKGRYKIFISHLAAEKSLAAVVKRQFATLGCAAFVAHEDIEPTKEWQEEIELALQSMDCLVALLTVGFHDSKWTDQEIGYALGNGKVVFPVSLGCDPYGFIGKVQAIRRNKEKIDDVGWQVFKRLPCFTSEEDAFVKAVESVSCFDDAVALAKLFSRLAPLSSDAVARIANIAVDNRYIRESNTFWYKTKHSNGFHYYVLKWLGYDIVYDCNLSRYVKSKQ